MLRSLLRCSKLRPPPRNCAATVLSRCHCVVGAATTTFSHPFLSSSSWMMVCDCARMREPEFHSWKLTVECVKESIFF